jgi:hypothetical protein
MEYILVAIVVIVVLVILFSQNNSPSASPLASGNRTPKEKRDLAEMAREAPNAEPKDVEGTIIWYEWTTQGGRKYHLAYWYGDNDYEAAVMEGDNPEDRGNAHGCHLFDDRRICLKDSNSSEPPYTRVAEARARAILWALGYSEYLRTGVFPWNEVKR